MKTMITTMKNTYIIENKLELLVIDNSIIERVGLDNEGYWNINRICDFLSFKFVH